MVWSLFHRMQRVYTRDIQIPDSCISVFPFFFSVDHCFRGWSKIKFKVYNVISCLNKNLTHFVLITLSTDAVLNKEHFYRKIMQKICIKKLVPDPF